MTLNKLLTCFETLVPHQRQQVIKSIFLIEWFENLKQAQRLAHKKVSIGISTYQKAVTLHVPKGILLFLQSSAFSANRTKDNHTAIVSKPPGCSY
jgi:hypothetical protein